MPRGLTGFWRFEVRGSRFEVRGSRGMTGVGRRGGERQDRSFRLRLHSGPSTTLRAERKRPANAAIIGLAEAGPLRFLTQRAARSRAGFEAPSQRRDVGYPY